MTPCPHCHSSHTINWASQPNKVKRHFCRACGKTFNDRYGTLFYRRKLSDTDIIESIKLFFTGTPPDKIAWVKDTTEKTVRGLLRESVVNFDRFEQFRINYDNYIPDVIEIDEIHIKLQGEIVFYAWIAYDPKNKFIIDVEFGTRDKETLERLFQRLQRWRAKVKLVLVDGYKGYEDVIRKYLGRTQTKPLTGVINKSRWCKKTNGFLTYGLFGRSRGEVEKYIQELGIGNVISTALIERMNRDFRDNAQTMRRRTHRKARLLEWVKLAFKGIRFIHNCIKPHLSLSFCSSKNWIQLPITPAMEIGVSQKVLTINEVLATPTLK